jgi:hypothetical protein
LPDEPLDDGNAEDGEDGSAQREVVLDIQTPPEWETGVYANFLAMWHTAHEFTLDFSVSLPAEEPEGPEGPLIIPVRVVARVKVPASALFDAVLAYHHERAGQLRGRAWAGASSGCRRAGLGDNGGGGLGGCGQGEPEAGCACGLRKGRPCGSRPAREVSAGLTRRNAVDAHRDDACRPKPPSEGGLDAAARRHWRHERLAERGPPCHPREERRPLAFESQWRTTCSRRSRGGRSPARA